MDAAHILTHKHASSVHRTLCAHTSSAACPRSLAQNCIRRGQQFGNRRALRQWCHLQSLSTSRTLGWDCPNSRELLRVWHLIGWCPYGPRALRFLPQADAAPVVATRQCLHDVSQHNAERVPVQRALRAPNNALFLSSQITLLRHVTPFDGKTCTSQTACFRIIFPTHTVNS